MSSTKALFNRFVREESGATMVEYGIMVALIAALAIAVIKVVGQKTNNGFQNVNAAWT
jgi:pilus assembly protein Flp/PilA